MVFITSREVREAYEVFLGTLRRILFYSKDADEKANPSRGGDAKPRASSITRRGSQAAERRFLP